MNILLLLVAAVLVFGFTMLAVRAPQPPPPPTIVHIHTSVQPTDNTGCLLLAIPAGIVLLLLVWGGLIGAMAP